MPSKKSYVFSLILIICHIAISPNYGQLIRGSVLDKSTGKQVPFVSIYSPSTGAGTLSNENGDFEIRVKSFPVQLVISHLSYQSDTITFTAPTNNYIIHLKPAAHELAPVNVSNAGYKLVQHAFERVQADKGTIYGKAFYRQLTTNGEQHTEIQEVIYSVKLSSSKIEGVQIDHARYAKLPFDEKKIYINFSNFSYLVLAQKAIGWLKPNVNIVLSPVRDDVADYYDVRVTDIVEQSNGDKIAELDCRIREDYIRLVVTG